MDSKFKKVNYSSQWPRDMVDSSLDRYLIGDKDNGEFDGNSRPCAEV